MVEKQSPIFSKTYDLILWLIPVLTAFPKDQRFRLAGRLEDAVFRLYDHLLQAAFSREKHSSLAQADLELERLRMLLRLSQELHLISFKQYEHAARLTSEVGKLLGGWLKTITTTTVGERTTERGGGQ